MKNAVGEMIQNSVHEFRKKGGMTQQELADIIGVTRQTVISIEKGNYVPSVLLALKIANLYKVTVDEIFTISYEK